MVMTLRRMNERTKERGRWGYSNDAVKKASSSGALLFPEDARWSEGACQRTHGM